MLTLFTRTLQIVFKSYFRPRLTKIGAEAVSTFRVWPTDLDWNMHMNNARYLTYFEVSRHDLQIRLGFLKLALKRGWYAPIKGAELEFLRPLKVFQKFEVAAQIVTIGVSDIVVYQEVRRGDKIIARGAIRTVIKKGRDTISPDVFLSDLGMSRDHLSPSESVKAWLHGRFKIEQ